jgi:predicted amidohydrolase
VARVVRVAAAQMGPNQDGVPRDDVVSRMLGLLERAIDAKADLVVYPEMALTTYFCKKLRDDFDQFFEREIPPKALAALLQRAKQAGIAVQIGFCEKADGKYFNSSLLVDKDGASRGVYRKIHLPGAAKDDGVAKVFELRYFEHGDRGFEVHTAAGARIGMAICQDRRFPETYRVLALKGAEIITIGYNTPVSSMAMEHSELCMRGGAYANNCYVIGVAKAGVEDGMELIGGTCIIAPTGQVLARAVSNGDELVVATLDFDAVLPFRKWRKYLSRRQPQHYGELLRPVRADDTPT